MGISISNDIAAHQELNRMVRDLSSSKQKLKIIHIIIIIGLIFAVFSIGGSAYGVYYDMLLDYGHAPSIMVGAMVGFTIEAVKLVGAWGFFAYAKLHLKLIFFALLALFTTFAIQLHYIGATNMEVTKRVQVIEQIQQKNMAYRADENKRKNKIVELMGGVLQNGTSRDDKLATKTLEQIDSKEQSLYSQGKISELDHEQIMIAKDAAKKRGNSMRKLLPLFEIFSIFGLLGAYLKTQSVSENVKEVIDVIDTHVEKESSIIYAENATSIKEAEEVAYVKNQLEQQGRLKISNLPTAKKASTPMGDILEDLNHGNELTEEQRVAIMAVLRKGQANEPFEQEKPKVVEHKKIVIGTTTVDEKKDEKKEDKIPFEPKSEKAIDFSTYSHQEQELIKILWDNGNVKSGSYLIERTHVIADAKQFLIPRAGSILTNLYDNLMIHGMIERPDLSKGYIAKVSLKKELWTEKE